MAVANFQKPPKPIVIDVFKGLNESVANTEIEVGECSFMENFRITKNYKLKKRPGHHTFINFTTDAAAKGIWYGTIAGKTIMLVCWNGNVYEYDMSVSTDTVDIADLITEGTVTIIGTITDVKTSIAWFQDKIYFLNGTDYKEYDGITYQDAAPYIPTIALNAPPSGGGTLFQESNLLTGLKTQTFVGDGSTVLYQLAETNIDATLLVITVNGVSLNEGVDFTVNRVLGQVTFTVAPANQASVSITWEKVVAGNEDLVKNHKYMVQYGVNSDTNLFIFGNENEKHVFRYSDVARANYFPANSFVGVDSTEFFITDLVPQYQSLLVYKEDSAFVVNPTINPNYENNTGLNPYNYGYEGLNNTYGNSAFNMVQLIQDNAVTLDGFSFRLWESTRSVSNEVEPKIISDRIKLSLQELDLSTATTYEYKFQKELWVNIGNKVYIWNYGNDTMYIYTNIVAHGFIDVEGDIYYTSDGTVEEINENFIADNEPIGDTIPCVAKLGFTDLGMLDLQKTMRDQWIAIEPAARTSVNLSFATDKLNEATAKVIEVAYQLFNFAAIDFSDFSFSTFANPQPKRTRLKIKKFTYLQTIFENDTNDETLTILKILLPVKTNRNSG